MVSVCLAMWDSMGRAYWAPIPSALQLVGRAAWAGSVAGGLAQPERCRCRADRGRCRLAAGALL